MQKGKGGTPPVSGKSVGKLKVQSAIQQLGNDATVFHKNYFRAVSHYYFMIAT